MVTVNEVQIEFATSSYCNASDSYTYPRGFPQLCQCLSSQATILRPFARGILCQAGKSLLSP